MYRRFVQNLKLPQMTNKGNNDIGYFLPNYRNDHSEEKTDNSNTKKLIANRKHILLEDVINPMKILLMFPDICFEAKNIFNICSPLNIKYNVVSSEEDALSAISSDCYDLFIIDRRRYGKGFKINADRFVQTLRDQIKPIGFKIVLYDDRPSIEFNQIWEAGYDELWINYDKLSLKNYIESYLKNQFSREYHPKMNSLINSAFDKFIDCIEILNNDFSIELVNETFQKTFKVSSDNLKGTNWFIFHKLTDHKKELIINDLNSKQSWEGFINHKTDTQNESLENIFVVIKPLEDHDGKYVVIINGIYNSQQNSVTVFSYERDSSTISMSKGRDNYFTSQQVSIDSPIMKIMKIISSIQDISSPLINHLLQRIVEILYSKDLFNTTVDALKTDKISSNLIDGLLSNNATIFAQTENRRQSSSLTKTKINKMPELPENEEIGVIDAYLENYRLWSFDILELEKLSENKPLRFIGMKVFTQFDLGSVLNIDSKLFQNWLYVIETNYNDNNCYHNSTHAADVLQSSIWFLERDRLSEIFDSYDDTISIIAAIIHDLGHPGRTNPFLINSNHSLAVLYNDIAVLENHHASFAFKLTLKDERINIFKNMNRDDYRSIRHGIIDAVLATEMAKHFEHLTKFVNNIINLKDHSKSNASSIDNSSANNSTALVDPENKAIIRRMLIKCSDVNNPTRPFNLCKEWAYRISEEYFNQTDDEISQGLPVVMPQFNRLTCDIPKSQIYFIDIFLQDMFTVWNDFIEVTELLNNLNDNKEKWKMLSVNTADSAKTLDENSKDK